jgi:hypothetical protein
MSVAAVLAHEMANLLGLGLFMASHDSNSSSHKTPINLNSHNPIITNSLSTWVKENPQGSTPRANFEFIVVKTDGQTNISANVLSEQPGNHPLSRVLPTERVSFLRKSELRRNNPTRPYESVSVFNSSRTERSNPSPRIC